MPRRHRYPRGQGRRDDGRVGQRHDNREHLFREIARLLNERSGAVGLTMVTACGDGLSMEKKRKQSDATLFKIFGKGVVSVCVRAVSTGVKAFPNPTLCRRNLIGSPSAVVGLP